VPEQHIWAAIFLTLPTYTKYTLIYTHIHTHTHAVYIHIQLSELLKKMLLLGRPQKQGTQMKKIGLLSSKNQQKQEALEFQNKKISNILCCLTQAWGNCHMNISLD
jgi:hypothetical protein